MDPRTPYRSRLEAGRRAPGLAMGSQGAHVEDVLGRTMRAPAVAVGSGGAGLPPTTSPAAPAAAPEPEKPKGRFRTLAGKAAAKAKQIGSGVKAARAARAASTTEGVLPGKSALGKLGHLAARGSGLGIMAHTINQDLAEGGGSFNPSPGVARNTLLGAATLANPVAGLAGLAAAPYVDKVAEWAVQPTIDAMAENSQVKFGPEMEKILAGRTPEQYQADRKAALAAGQEPNAEPGAYAEPPPPTPTLAQLPKANEATIPGQPNLPGLSRTARYAPVQAAQEVIPDVRAADDEGYLNALKGLSPGNMLGVAALSRVKGAQNRREKSDRGLALDAQQRNATRAQEAETKNAELGLRFDESETTRAKNQFDQKLKLAERGDAASKAAVEQYKDLLERTFQKEVDGKIIPDLDGRERFERSLKNAHPDWLEITDPAKREELFAQTLRTSAINDAAQVDARNPSLLRRATDYFGATTPAREDDRAIGVAGVPRTASMLEALTSNDVGYGDTVFPMANGALVSSGRRGNVQVRGDLVERLGLNPAITTEQILAARGDTLTDDEVAQILAIRQRGLQ